MTSFRGSSRPRRVAVATAAVLAICGVGGCSSTASGPAPTSAGPGTNGSASASAGANAGTGATSGNDGWITAKSEVTDARRTVTGFKSPGPAFNAAGAKGKSVWYVVTLASIPIFHAIYGQLDTALSKAGVHTTLCDGQGSPSGQNSCIRQAISQHANAIIIDSISPQVVTSAQKAAQAAGIVTIYGNISDPTVPGPNGSAATVSFPYSTLGHLVAASVIADSKGKANVFIASTNDTPQSDALVNNGMISTFKDLCKECKYDVQAVPVADWGTRLQSLTSSALARNSHIDYTIAEYDAMTADMLPVLKTHNLDVYTVNADLAQMKQLQQGSPIAVDVGSSPAYEGWVYADEILRLLNHKPAVKGEVPVRLFDRSNVKGLNLTQAASESFSWYGKVDYQSKFLKLWGLG